jgi:hypothetical protein
VIVFTVAHECPDPGCDGDSTEVKFIGVYSSRNLAEEAVARLRTKPGFAGSPGGFSIDAVQLDQTSWEDGFVTG